MLLDILSLLLKLGGYFWDIGVDILVGRQQIEKTFPQYRFEGKQYHHIQGDFFQVGTSNFNYAILRNTNISF